MSTLKCNRKAIETQFFGVAAGLPERELPEIILHFFYNKSADGF